MTSVWLAVNAQVVGSTARGLSKAPQSGALHFRLPSGDGAIWSAVLCTALDDDRFHCVTRTHTADQAADVRVVTIRMKDEEALFGWASLVWDKQPEGQAPEVAPPVHAKQNQLQ